MNDKERYKDCWDQEIKDKEGFSECRNMILIVWVRWRGREQAIYDYIERERKRPGKGELKISIYIKWGKNRKDNESCWDHRLSDKDQRLTYTHRKTDTQKDVRKSANHNHNSLKGEDDIT